MRYYHNTRQTQILLIVMFSFNGVILILDAVHHRTGWNMILAGTWLILLISEIANRRISYMEVGNFGLIKRHLWRRQVYPYSEITYVGPPTGKRAIWYWADRLVEVRSSAQKPSIFMPAETKSFLADLHNHLTEEVFHFNQTPP